MKRLYWRPRRISLAALLGITALAACAALAVECFPRLVPAPGAGEKLSAARLARRMFHVLKSERLRRGLPLEVQFDPACTGIVGTRYSSVTSLSGHLPSKQQAVNPNFAAVVVDMLRRAGVRRGDVVAVGYTGSMPGMNVAVCAALETIQARPVIISSVCSSQFGANLPEFLWIDMERHLFERGLISFHSLAASPGGYEDQALGLDETGRGLIRRAIARYGLREITAGTYRESLDERMQIYREQAGGDRIAAYINVGGGTVSVGRSLGKRLYRHGLNLAPPPDATSVDSVMTRFMKDGVPVLHLVEMPALAREYGLSWSPAGLPPVGEGRVFAETRYNRPLAAALLAAIVLALAAASGVRLRSRKSIRRDQPRSAPSEPQTATIRLHHEPESRAA